MKKENAIRWAVIIFISALFIAIAAYAARTCAKDNYKKKYQKLLKKYEILQKKYYDLGNENEGHFQDYLQCQKFVDHDCKDWDPTQDWK